MDPDELDYEEDWAHKVGFYYDLIREYDPGKCIPLMCDDEYGGAWILTAEDKLYQWWHESYEIAQIIFTTTLAEIVTAFKDNHNKWLQYNKRLEYNKVPGAYWQKGGIVRTWSG